MIMMMMVTNIRMVMLMIMVMVIPTNLLVPKIPGKTCNVDNDDYVDDRNDDDDFDEKDDNTNLKMPSEMGVAPRHKRFTQFSALIKL